MGAHRVVTCENWHDFKSEVIINLFKGKPFVMGNYLFRGHGSAHWPLTPSFDRVFNRLKLQNKAVQVERLLALFKREAGGMGVETHIWENEISLLALAQHYGLPTRLLDWTESPYIGAFFAFAGISLNPDLEEFVSIWCLDVQSDIWSRESGVEILSVPPLLGNERLRNQFGKFTLLRAPYDSLEEHVSHFEGGGDALIQFLLPRREGGAALSDLDAMGINYSRMFPGVEGAARAAGLKFQLEHLQR